MKGTILQSGTLIAGVPVQSWAESVASYMADGMTKALAEFASISRYGNWEAPLYLPGTPQWLIDEYERTGTLYSQPSLPAPTPLPYGVVIAQANSVEELQSAFLPYKEIPAGTPIKIRLELAKWFPMGKLADLAGAEFWAKHLIRADMDVLDVYGDWYWIEIEGKARGLAVPLLIAIIAGAVAVLGLAAFITSVVITAKIEKEKLQTATDLINKGLTPEEVSQVLEATKPAAPKLPTVPKLPTSALAGLGIGTGAIIAIVAGLLLLSAKR